jgi:hypothetical protein
MDEEALKRLIYQEGRNRSRGAEDFSTKASTIPRRIEVRRGFAPLEGRVDGKAQFSELYKSTAGHCVGVLCISSR